MSDHKPQLTETAPSPPAEPRRDKHSSAPLCLIVDEESSIRQFISLILHGLGIDTIELADGAALRAVRTPRPPDLIFHDISLDSADAIESLLRLSKRNYNGPVQLMSRRGAAVLEHVRKVGVEHKLNMLPALKKPFGGDAIIKIVQELEARFLTGRCRQRQSRRCHCEELDRVLVSAGHRSAQEATGRRRNVRAHSPSRSWHHFAGRIYCRRIAGIHLQAFGNGDQQLL